MVKFPADKQRGLVVTDSTTGDEDEKERERLSRGRLTCDMRATPTSAWV